MSSEQKITSVPGLQELFKQLLGERVQAAGAGFLSERLPEVVPYEAVPPLAIDAGLAWAEALEAGKGFGLATSALECPAGWADLVADTAPLAAVPMCLGNFPQMMRDVKALAEVENLPSLRPQPLAVPAEASAVKSWRSDDTTAAARLVRAGLLRLLGQYAGAKEGLAGMPEGRGKLGSALHNERAALAWHQGDHQRALDLWKEAKEDIPVLFNRGLSLLFCGQAGQARPLFDRVLEALPASSGWRQLAELYLAVVELKS
jgi:tetratricopeptide (TPR) repeat protein